MGTYDLLKSKKYQDALAARKARMLSKNAPIVISDTFPEKLKPKHTDRTKEPPKEYEFPVKEVSTDVRNVKSDI